MCGIAGFSLTGAEDSDSISRLLTTFLLKGIENRGRDATGAAWYDRKGEAFYQKEGVTATDWLKKHYQHNVKSAVAILHTRAGTHGSAEDNNNNHPIVVPNVVGVHNGVLDNDDELFRDLAYPRIGKVDSEIMFQMLADTSQGLQGVVQEVRGDAAIAWLDLRDKNPTLRMANLGGRPLCYVRTHSGSLIFASTMPAIDEAVKKLNNCFPRLDMAITERSSNTDGMEYEVVDGQIVAQRECGKLKARWSSTGAYSSGWSGSGGSTAKVYFSHGIEERRQPYYATVKCLTCGKYSGCVCRYSRFPLPGYPEVQEGWVRVQDHPDIAAPALRNGESVRPTNHVGGSLFVLGGFLVDYGTWNEWKRKVQEIDDTIADEKLLSCHVIRADEMGGKSYTDMDYGTLMQTPSGDYLLRQGARADNELLLVTKHQALKIAKMREYRRFDQNGVYLIPYNTANKDAYPETGDLVVYDDTKTSNVWKIRKDGSTALVGRWSVLFESTKKKTLVHDRDDDDLEFYGGAFATQNQLELPAAKDEVDDEEVFDSALMAALRIVTFTALDEVRHSYLLNMYEADVNHRVTQLVHWKSGRLSVVVDTGQGDIVHHHSVHSHNLVSTQTFCEPETSVTSWLLNILMLDRAVVEDISPEEDDNGTYNIAHFKSGEDLETLMIERTVPLRFDVFADDDDDDDEPIEAELIPATTTSPEEPF